MVTEIKNCTKSDATAMNCVIACIEQLKRETSEAYPEYTPSDWQYVEMLVERYGLSSRRIDRLVELGMLESKPSDGLGPQVKINPEWRRYL